MLNVQGIRVLCVSEARGALSKIEEQIEKHSADAVIHVGSFGFFDGESAINMNAESLAFAANTSRVVNGSDFHNMEEQALREKVGSQLSELSLFIAGVKKFSKPVYCLYGSCEDSSVVEKLRSEVYHVPNLFLVDEFNAPLINGTKIRLLGLPGQFDKYKLLNAGKGDHKQVAGDGVNMWSTLWQLGELFHTARNNFDAKEVRLFMTDTSPSHQALLQYIAILLRADFYISGDQPGHTNRFRNSIVEPHSPFVQSYNICGTGVELYDYIKRLNFSKEAFNKEWNSVKQFVKRHSQPNQLKLLESTVELLTVFSSNVLSAHIERAYRSLWFFRLGTIDSIQTILTITDESHVSLSSFSSGLDFSNRLSTDPNPEGEKNGGNGEEWDRERDRKKHERRKRESDEKKEKRKIREKMDKDSTPYGLWFRNGDRPVEEILGCLDEKDRQLNPKVVIKSGFKPQGDKTNVAYVFFQTEEQASQAYQRVDKDEAGTVSIYQPELYRSKHTRKR